MRRTTPSNIIIVERPMSANTVLHAHRAMAEDAKIRFMANFLTLGGLKTWKLGKKAKSDY